MSPISAHARRLALAPLVCLTAALGSCGDATAPSNESRIAVGDVRTGDLVAGSAAQFLLKVRQGERAAIYLASPEPNVSLQVSDHATQRVVGRVTGTSASTTSPGAAVLTPPSESDVTYALEVAVVGSASSGSYRLEVAGVDRRPEVAAAVLQPGSEIVESIEHPADLDEFSLSLDAGQSIVVFFQKTSPTATGTLYADLTPSAGAIAGFPLAHIDATSADRSREEPASGRIAVTVPGDYRLTIASDLTRGAEYVGPYRLGYLVVNRQPEQAPVGIVPGDTVATERIDHVGDIDEFTLDAPAGEVFNLFVEANGEPPHAVVAYVNSLGSSSANAAADGSHLLDHPSGTFVMPASDHATIVVSDTRDREGLYLGPYRLLVAPIDPAPESGSADITVGEDVMEAIDIAGDVDEYRVAVTTPALVNLVLEAGAGATGTELRAELYPDGGEIGYPLSYLSTTSAPGMHADRHLMMTPGTYRLRVFPTLSTGTGYRGAYRVTLRPVPRAPESVPARIAIGDTVRDEILDDALDVDAFEIAVTAADTFLVRLAPSPETPVGAIQFYVRDATGTVRAFSARGVVEGDRVYTESALLALDPGDYTVEVGAYHEGAAPEEHGAYTLTLPRVSAAPERHASSLMAGDTVRDEVIDFIGDVDDFVVRGTPGREVSAVLTWTVVWTQAGPSGSGGMGFIDPTTGAILGGASSYGSPEYASRVRFPASGELHLRVQSYAGVSAYTVAIVDVDPAPELRAAAFAVGDTVADAIDPNSDVDEFHFDGAAGQVVDLFLQLPNGYPGASTAVGLTIIDLTSGETVTSLSVADYTANLEDVARRGITLPSTGTYLVRVSTIGQLFLNAPYRFLLATP
jgi:hypothetical protein